MTITEATQTLQYAGDITPDGEIQPFRLAAVDGVHQDAIDELDGTPGIQVVDNPTEAQGILLRSATKFVDEESFRRHAQIMQLIRVGVGHDNLDKFLASRHGVATLNTPGASTDPVARRALAFMLEWAGRISEGTRSLRAHQWAKKPESKKLRDLSEMTLGIVGYGRIGQATERFARPHFRKTVFTDVRDVDGKIPLENLLAESDVVSLNVAGNDEVLIPEAIALMKDDALLINTSRGKTINPKALLAKMDQGLTVALDVFPKEGNDMFDNEMIRQIIDHPNFRGTPHTAASDQATQRKLGLEGAQRMTEFATQGIVNPQNIQGHTLPAIDLGMRKTPGIRGLLTHESVPGKLEAITGALAEQRLNIVDCLNREGGINGGHRLAITAFDLGTEVEPEEASTAMRHIQTQVDAYKTRLLFFGTAPSHDEHVTDQV